MAQAYCFEREKAKAFKRAVLRRFPGRTVGICRRPDRGLNYAVGCTVPGVGCSQHNYGNACDIMTGDPGNPKNVELNRRIAAWARANARAFDIADIRFYDTPGDSAHDNHVHVDFTPYYSGTPPGSVGGNAGVVEGGSGTYTREELRRTAARLNRGTERRTAAAGKVSGDMARLGITGFNANHEGPTAVLGRFFGFYLPQFLKVAGGGVIVLTAVLGLVAIAFLARDPGATLSRSLAPVAPKRVRQGIRRRAQEKETGARRQAAQTRADKAIELRERALALKETEAAKAEEADEELQEWFEEGKKEGLKRRAQVARGGFSGPGVIEPESRPGRINTREELARRRRAAA